MNSGLNFWIISFSSDDAHIVEAATEEDIIENPKTTYRVHYTDLRYKYIDIDEEAKKITTQRKNQINPILLFDPNTTIDDILAMPQMKERESEKKNLTKTLEFLRKAPPELKQKKIREYQEAQEKTEEELYQQILGELQQKREYFLEQIPHFTFTELNVGLPQAGYAVERKGFMNLQDCLGALYDSWEEMRSDPKRK